MKKSYLIMAAIASVALASCSDEQFVGEVDPGTGQGNPTVIRFGSLGKGLTRADLTGEAAAGKLKNNFVFEGTKAVGNTTYSLVINDYQANYANNTAHQTESNSNNWEYVGYKNVPGGVTANTGVPTFAATTDNTNAITQSIKYWDYGTTQYDFAAYSLGIGATANNATTYAKASAIDLTKAGSTTATDFVYSLTGTADQLKACYISDLVTAYNKKEAGTDNNPDIVGNDFGNVVTFSFRSLAAKIRLAFYETVPGYSVKDVKFYTSDDATLATDGKEKDPTLYVKTSGDFKGIPSGSGTMKITFPTVGWDNSPKKNNATNYNKAHVAFAATSDNDFSSTLVLEDLTDLAAAESKETAGNTYLGRSSNNATYAGGLDNGTGKYYTILPYEDGANLLLRIKYTLVSIDGSGEEITVDNATAVIPAELAKWNPNYAYTYIFKISDMTNGATGFGPDGTTPVYGLTPITLNAVVVDSEDGIQETITTVSTPSITTYTQGQVVTANDEYISGNKIYVIVNNGTENVALKSDNDTKAKLYTVQVSNNALQTISEESVDNAIRYGTYDETNKKYTVTDINQGTLTVTEVAENTLTIDSKIAAADSPTGNEITIGNNKVAMFTAGAAGTIYAFQYRKVDADKTTYTAVEANTYNEKIPGAISITSPATKTGYKFESYGSADNSQPYGNGKAKVISVANGWTTVLVTSNSIAGFAGKQYKVQTPDANGFYQLYETNGTPTGIYVTVTSEDYTDTEVYNYNITLPGAVKEGTIKPDAYGYKIIKIKE